MGTRSMTTVVTADTMALNAAVFGFAGHSVLTPHQAIQSIWWTDERIEAIVTREFVVSKLRPGERDQLFQPMFVDSGLTEDTYLDWVLSRAKRMFLVLVECGVSDQIFGIAEDSWDDDDLPISLDEVPRLALSYKDDDLLNKRFYNNQFRFLLRTLDFHNHIDYAPIEVVPIEYVHRLAPAAALQKWSRIHLPKMPTLIYVSRKVLLGEKDEINPNQKQKFLEDIQTARSVEHEHIAPVLASWSQKNIGYFMTSFVAEHNLKSFIDFRTPASMQKVKKQDRQCKLLEWIHCLAHAVAYLHRKRIAHSAICPTNILIDENNKIAFADLGFLETFQRDKKFDTDELYNYGAPELFPLTTKSDFDVPAQLSIPTSRKFFHKRRKSANSNSGSDTSSDAASALSVDTKGNFSFKSRSNSVETITPITPRSSDKSAPPRINTQDFSVSSTLRLPFDRLSLSSVKTSAPPPSIHAGQESSDYNPDRQAADIFSLGCIFLDIITFLLKRKPNEFSKHRSTKLKNASGKGSHTDVSFHNNSQKVQTWMEILENDLPSTQEQALFALQPLFRLTTEMLSPEPHRRPSAADVQEHVYDALYNYGGLEFVHCDNDDQRPTSKMSFARTSTSGGSSEPRLAAFPPILSLSPPSSTPSVSSRRPITPASSSSNPLNPKTDSETSTGPAPAPPLGTLTHSRSRLRRWGHQKKASVDSSKSGGVGVSA